MTSYYIYLALLDGVPRYVGFGTKNRKDHVNSGISHIRRLNEVVLRDNRQFEIKLLEINLTKDEANLKEIHYIAKFGREDLGTGTLWNQTNGGIGFRNYHTEESKKHIAKKSQEMWDNLSDGERQQRKNRFLEVGKNTRFQPGQKSHNACPVMVNGVVYESIREAALMTNQSVDRVRKYATRL